MPLGYNVPSDPRALPGRIAGMLSSRHGKGAGMRKERPHHDLIFFGYPYYRSGRGRCYERLSRVLGSRLNATWSVWNQEAFDAWWLDEGRWAAHLNLHKGCENPRNPVVFRTSLLLSRGALVLSEHANPMLAGMFRNIVS